MYKKSFLSQNHLLGWLTFYRLGWVEFYSFFYNFYFLDKNWTFNIVCLFHTEGSWTLKVGKWPWTFPSKWVDITRRCRSSWYDKFLSKRTRLVTFPSWKCQFYVLPDFCYILKHFCRILLNTVSLNFNFCP